MAQLEQIRKARLKKLEAFKKALINPYPATTKRTHEIKEALENFDKILAQKKEIFLVGRIRAIRTHGGLTFFNFEDQTGKIQALLKKDFVGEKAYEFFLNNFDVGDFVQVRGILIKTKKGEKTIQVLDYKILTKSILPLPEKWHGLKDVDERYRKRYLDLIFNPEVKEKFILRSKIISEIRKILEEEGFLEVETPILQPIYGGARARPFESYFNALDMKVYLRIAPELYLKRLLVGGFEKVFELGKVFRNEGIDRSHNPEYTHLEFYAAYWDYKDLMKFVEKFFEKLLLRIFKTTKIKYQGKEVDFKTPWPRIEFVQLLKKHTKIDIEEIHLKALKEKAKKLQIEVQAGEGKAEIADKLYKKYCLPEIGQPSFVIHHLREKSSLAKALEKNPKKIASLQFVAAGWELGWGYSELNDPIEQRKGFEEQEKIFKEGLEEAERMDEDYIEALEYGMPPAAGFGMGIDRLVALLTNSYNLREVILFPTMRPK